MSDVLARICADKRDHVAAAKQAVPLADLRRQADKAEPPRGFARALQAMAAASRFGLIAEVKKASPSKGLIRADFHPVELARAYHVGGAACLSVLTDEKYFQGADAFLREARAAVPLPVLRKDFMLDPYQVVEARALGADCILLIMAALTDAEALALRRAAADWGMDVLVEVHDAAELARALPLAAELVGVNNRNLKTMVTDLGVSEGLAADLPAGAVHVCESGLVDNADLQRMWRAGYGAFLVGESLMRRANVRRATSELLTPPPAMPLQAAS
jgi:indole-3-glycerol phosphate synthase